MGLEKKSLTPFVTVIIPTLNEERYIENCLISILSNDYPSSCLEILVIDGQSVDATINLVKNLQLRYNHIRLLNNPKRIQAAALNLGINEAKGDIILRADGHSLYAKDYISASVQLLRTTDSVNVGGKQIAYGTNNFSKAVACCLKSFVGVGDAAKRSHEKSYVVDSVSFGAWWKDDLIQLGGFNEEWVANEDYELNYRLRSRGGIILYSPTIRFTYFPRENLSALARQYWRNGFWRSKTLVTYPKSFKMRQVAAPILLIAFIGSIGLLPFLPLYGLIIPIVYTSILLIDTLRALIKEGQGFILYLPMVYVTIHLSFGLGFFAGLSKWLGRDWVKKEGRNELLKS